MVSAPIGESVNFKTLNQRGHRMTEDPANALGGLDPYEVAIMELVIEGLPNMAIGQRLEMKEGDVMRSVARIFRKLNVQNRTQARRTWQEIKADITKTDPSRPIRT